MATTKGTRARRTVIAPDPDEMARARLAAIEAASHDAIVAANRAGTITDWNPAAERLFGRCAAEAVGRSLAIIVPPEQADGMRRPPRPRAARRTGRAAPRGPPRRRWSRP